MENLLNKLVFYFEYPIVRYALIAGVLISLCASLLGVTLVLKRYSFMGDGLSHVAFGAVAIASVLRISNSMLIVMPVTILFAVLLLCTGRNAKIKGDAAIAMLSVGALGIGYLLMHIFGASSNVSGDVCTSLFGSASILTLTAADVWVCVVMSILVIAVYLLFYNKIFAVTYDETFARATGIHSGGCDGGDYCACHESCGIAADFGADYIPRLIRHAFVSKLSLRCSLQCCFFCGLCSLRNPDFRIVCFSRRCNHCLREYCSIWGIYRFGLCERAADLTGAFLCNPTKDVFCWICSFFHGKIISGSLNCCILCYVHTGAAYL